MSRGRVAIIALCALVVVLVGWILLRPDSPASEDRRAPDTATVESSVPGVPSCPLATLPREAADTVRRIRAGGPFPHPRNDGVVFRNREGQLPDKARGYYREYTVITPGASNRSTKRIVTGGAPPTDPPQYFYTGDHYDSFCLVTDAGRQQ